jgi:hypothetical protein
MNDYFCVLPFYGMEYSPTSPNTPCCLLPANVDVKDLQQTILNGQRHSACQRCWTLEDQNKPSNRQILNQSFDLYADRDINFVEEDCRTGKFSTQIVKLYTSNLCNGTCVVCCNDEVSTAWATLNGRSTFKILADQTISDIDYSNIKILSFVGGEPLYEKKNILILQKLIDCNNTTCFISMVTNGSVKLSIEYLDILAKFKNLNFCLSIDGVGQNFEYQRYPLKWDLLTKNINIYRQLGINLSVSYTISNINIFYHSQTTAWFKSMGLEYNFNLVEDPAYFSINSLPKSIKDKLLDVQELFRPHTPVDDENFLKAVEEIKRQDALKKISIRDYMPEIANWFN